VPQRSRGVADPEGIAHVLINGQCLDQMGARTREIPADKSSNTQDLQDVRPLAPKPLTRRHGQRLLSIREATVVLASPDLGDREREQVVCLPKRVSRPPTGGDALQSEVGDLDILAQLDRAMSLEKQRSTCEAPVPHLASKLEALCHQLLASGHVALEQRKCGSRDQCSGARSIVRSACRQGLS
jgi:hypothetical protein